MLNVYFNIRDAGKADEAKKEPGKGAPALCNLLLLSSLSPRAYVSPLTAVIYALRFGLLSSCCSLNVCRGVLHLVE